MRNTTPIHPLRSGAGALVAAMACLAVSPVFGREASPFEGYSGTWTGGGLLTMTSGTQERVRCKASYSPGPDTMSLQMSIVCASDSYKIQVTSNLAARGGQLSGTWQEATRQISGDITGRIPGPGQIEATLGGTPLNIGLSFGTRGKQQGIAIRVENSDVQSADIQMHRN